MNQNNSRDVEEIEATLQALSFWNELDIDGQCELRETHHQELQKAREEERESVRKKLIEVHELMRNQNWTDAEYRANYMHALRGIIN
jgi:hypothetical protein